MEESTRMEGYLKVQLKKGWKVQEKKNERRYKKGRMKVSTGEEE